MLNKLLLVCFIGLHWANADLSHSSNVTNSRSKRGLVFSNGGVVNAVFGILVPIDIPKWQQINCLNNLRAQYAVPVDWKSVYNVFNGRATKPDSTRKSAYKLLEQVLNKKGQDGKSCVKRTICEVAEAPFKHNGMLGELFQFFFTPGKHEILNDDYREAMEAGNNGADCTSLFPKCPKGHGLLDAISVML